MNFYIKNIKFNLLIRNNILYETNVIYLLKINNQYYIGKTKREFLKRLKEHVGEIIFNNDIVYAFILCKCNSENELNKKEKEYIRYYRK